MLLSHTPTHVQVRGQEISKVGGQIREHADAWSEPKSFLTLFF